MIRLWKSLKVKATKTHHICNLFKGVTIFINKNRNYNCDIYTDNTIIIYNKDFKIQISSQMYEELFKPILTKEV